jgi:uncharacterized membrane protein
MSIGAIFGASVSILLNDNFPASYSFIGYGAMGFMVTILVASTKSEIE